MISFGMASWRVLKAAKKARALGEVSGGEEIHQEPARQVQGSPMAGESHVTIKSQTFRDPAALSASQSRPGTTVVSFDGPGANPADGLCRHRGSLRYFSDTTLARKPIHHLSCVSAFHAAVELESAAIEARPTGGPCQANKRGGHHRLESGGRGTSDGLARSAIPARYER